MKLVIDPSLAGISGDMLVGALLDLCQDDSRAIRAIEELVAWLQEKDDTFEIKISRACRKGISGTSIQTKTAKKGYLAPSEIEELIKSFLKSINASKSVLNFCLRPLSLILQAESKVHAQPLEEVHLHETGTVDTIFDICGTGLLLNRVGAFNEKAQILSLFPSVGRGTVETMHGLLPVPAPATLEILNNEAIPFQGGPENFELVTPTGAALLAAMDPKFLTTLPSMRLSAIGYGCGQRELPKAANVLRILMGGTSGEVGDSTPPSKVSVLETNLDDVSGEILGYLMQQLMDEGALDVTIIPAQTKKNRPTQIIQVITPIEKQQAVLRNLIQETGTLGVRIYQTHREVAQRSLVTRKVRIQGVEREIRVKIAHFDGQFLSCKPEYEDLRVLAKEFNLPLRIVRELVQTQFKCQEGK
ncbi:MAG: nickel pincer cofactor biosynthesis protein LarC [Candidatus Thorarchaeota archaeon]